MDSETPATPKKYTDRILSAEEAAPDAVDFTCPRCGREIEARFYGPCPDCTQALQAAYPQATKDVEAPEYEPKMNVTPNAIATKE